MYAFFDNKLKQLLKLRGEITWICTITKNFWIVAVVQEVLYVRQLMVNCYKIFMRNVSAHFNAAKKNMLLIKNANVIHIKVRVKMINVR
jgi:hypothetical protein